LQIKVDESSVNSILLDPTPHIRQRKVLVAGSVRITGMLGTSDKQLILDRTTLLPPIPGLFELLQLMFHPIVQLVMAQDGTPHMMRLFTLKTTGEVELLHDELLTIRLVNFLLNYIISN
jgi:hypothetical protein